MQRGYKVAHTLIEEVNEVCDLGELAKYPCANDGRALMLIDDLFTRKLPPNAGEELPDVLMSRYEKFSAMLTSDRSIEDRFKLLGDALVLAPLLDRLKHRENLQKFERKSWCPKEITEPLNVAAAHANIVVVKPAAWTSHRQGGLTGRLR